jgi:predicted ATPase
MLTRLAIRGFKNLVDVEVHFGPLTYIAGPNGAGKSNVFDAIQLLSMLADRPFIDAAKQVRGGADPHHLFSVGGPDLMEFECDVLIPRSGTDDFGQPADASRTYLNYSLSLRYEEHDGIPKIRLEREHLTYIAKGKARNRLAFASSDTWRESVIHGTTRTASFIETDERGHVRLWADRMQDDDKSKRGGGSPTEFIAERLPRTTLSSAQNAEEHRTAVLLRQEMRRWRQLQLEPSELREADDFQSPQSIAPSGAHVAATLYRLASSVEEPEDVYADIANRLAQLVPDVDGIRVERDEGRRLFTLLMRDRRGVELPASSLSDGTLRFIALAVMEADPAATGVVCLEEPENGIHPQRVAAMLELLDDMAVDPMEPAGLDNPLRQVIVSTHSPLVVSNARAEDVVFATPTLQRVGDRVVQGLRLRGLEGTWRGPAGDTMSKGAVLAYLDPAAHVDEHGEADGVRPRPRVRDVVRRPQVRRADAQTSLFEGEP